MTERAFVRWCELVPERVKDWQCFPFGLPPVGALVNRLDLSAPLTVLTGENGAGKSTILEALAVCLGLNAEGGTRNFAFASRNSTSSLHAAMRIARTERRPFSSFFLRAETLYNVATEIERLDEGGFGPKVSPSYGGAPLHELSHGQSFLSVIKHKMRPGGLYLMDEPEGALSVSNQLLLAQMIHADLRGAHPSQFVVATNSPVISAIPCATVLELSEKGIERIAWSDMSVVALLQEFLSDPGRYFERH